MMTLILKMETFSLKKKFGKSVGKIGSALILSLLGLNQAFADLAVPAGGAPVPGGAPGAQMAQPGGIMAFVPFILMFAVMYFLILRPQQKKMKEQQSMLAALKQGDEVLTASGLLGRVTGITEKVVTLEVADNVRVKMLKNQVSQVIKGSIKDLAQ